MAVINTELNYNGYLSGNKEVLTQLVLLYRQRLIQGIKSDNMLEDVFVFTSALRILMEYDASDIEAVSPSANIITPTQIRYVLNTCNCIRVKYNIDINFAAYILEANGGTVPATAILEENGDPLLTESADYILTE